jgi:hypothetical protein
VGVASLRAPLPDRAGSAGRQGACVPRSGRPLADQTSSRIASAR